MQMVFSLVICMLCIVACKESKPVQHIEKTDSVINFINYHYFLKYSESDQKNIQLFDKWYNSKKGKEACMSLIDSIKKKYNFEAVGFGAKKIPPHLLFFLQEPENVIYKRTQKGYRSLYPRFDSVRKEIINGLYYLSPVIDKLTLQFSDHSGTYYNLITSADTLYLDYIADPAIRKKVTSVKRGLQRICNWLTKLYNTYDRVRAEPNVYKEGSRTYFNVEFKIPLDSTQAKVCDSMYKVVIPELIKTVDSVSQDFQRICLDYGHFENAHFDTLYKSFIN